MFQNAGKKDLDSTEADPNLTGDRLDDFRALNTLNLCIDDGELRDLIDEVPGTHWA